MSSININIHAELFILSLSCATAAVGRWREPVWHQIHPTDASRQPRWHHTQPQCWARLRCESFFFLSPFSEQVFSFHGDKDRLQRNSQYSQPYVLQYCWSEMFFSPYRASPTSHLLCLKVWKKVFLLNRGHDQYADTTAAHAHPAGNAKIGTLFEEPLLWSVLVK